MAKLEYMNNHNEDVIILTLLTTHILNMLDMKYSEYNIIQSNQNVHIKHILQLISSNNYRHKNNQTILEGIHLVQAWFNQGLLPQYCIINEESINIFEEDSYINTPQSKIIQYLFNKHYRKILIVSKNIWSKLTNLPFNDMLWIIDTSTIVQDINKINLKSSGIILDNIQDSGNMGNIIRTAAATNYKWVLAIGGASICSPKVLRAGMGGHICLDIFQVNSTELANIQKFLNSTKIFVTSPHTRASIYNIDLPKVHAWVIGNEGNGVDESWFDTSTSSHNLNIQKVYIPQNNAIESLNASTAAAICMYENMRRNYIAK
ncbi:MAG: hypothetical protein RLZZ210_237 [Pseudomonadota bacterium]